MHSRNLDPLSYHSLQKKSSIHVYSLSCVVPVLCRLLPGRQVHATCGSFFCSMKIVDTREVVKREAQEITVYHKGLMAMQTVNQNITGVVNWAPSMNGKKLKNLWDKMTKLASQAAKSPFECPRH